MQRDLISADALGFPYPVCRHEQALLILCAIGKALHVLRIQFAA